MILNLPVFKTDNFLAEDDARVSYGFFGRQGGVSTGVYTSLNCGLGSGDDPAAVEENRQRVAQAVGAEDVLSLYQVHGADCARVDQAWDNTDRPEADAFVTDRVGIALGIVTADCAPVLFYADGASGPVIGAAHAGWRGALGGVLGATVEAMRGYDGVADIRAVIGPCIAKASYEVSLEFVKPFLEVSDEYERFFSSAASADKLLFDLAGFCAARLAEAGVGHVSIMDLDTYARDADFFSYRRATHLGEPDYARQLSVITIRPDRAE